MRTSTPQGDLALLKARANSALFQRRFSDAIELWRELVASSPGDLAARQRLAESFERAGNLHFAVQEYLHIADAHRDTSDYAKALAALKTAQRVIPGHPEVTARLQEVSAATGPALLPPKPLPRELTPRVLKAVPLFQDFDTPILERLSQGLRMRIVREGTRLTTEGEQSSTLFVLLRGRVQVLRPRHEEVRAGLAALVEDDSSEPLELDRETPWTLRHRGLITPSVPPDSTQGISLINCDAGFFRCADNSAISVCVK